MNTNPHSDVEYVLRRALTVTDFELASPHRWMWEGDRWHELVFALLTRVTALSEIQVREIVDDMSDLDLLDIQALAGLVQEGHKLNTDVPHGHRVREFLVDSGFKPEEAQKALVTMCELAFGLHSCFDGKLQRYLRHYGELMLKELNQYFHFSTLSQDDVGFAWTYWMQNVLNMPLSLIDDNVKKLSHELGIQPRELVSAADALDLNLALMDDVIDRYVTMREGSVAEQSQPAEASVKTP